MDKPQGRSRLLPRARVAGVLLGLGLLPPAAWPTAIPTTATFTVGATVTNGCFVSSSPSQTTGLAFGMVDFGAHPALTVGTQSASAGSGGGGQALLQCTPGTTVQVSVDGGLHATGTQRRLASASGAFASYLLYLSTAPTTPLLPNVAASLALGSTAVALPLTGTVTYPGAAGGAGTYTDTVQITVSW